MAKKKGSEDRGQGLGRREVLECMVWAGTGVLWAVSGGIPHSVGLIGDALAAESTGFTFLQMSDSHIGFDKAANPDALGTLREAVAKVKAMPTRCSARPAYRFTLCPASTTSSMKSAAKPIWNATARVRRAPAGTAMTITASTSSVSSTSLI